MPISDAAIARGLANVHWPARIELISRNPIVMLDTAHNVPSAQALADTLRDSFPVAGTKRVVLAVSADKNYRDMLRVLAGYFDHFHFTRYTNPRAVPPDKLAQALAEVTPGKAHSTHATSRDAWFAARAAAKDDDLICVTGSVFLAGELRAVVCGLRE
jgi:dihydrofolate synthase/folylpolyglutamate synthase